MEVMNLITKVIKQSGGKDKAAELNLSGIKIGRFTPEKTALIEQCKNLENLILSDCGLESLEGMPKLNLEGIDLTGNKLTDNDMKYLKGYSKLYHLLLTDNKIQNIDSLKSLSDCKDLMELDVSGNPVSQIDNYRTVIFGIVKSLTALDGKDADGNEVPEEQDLEDEYDEDDQDEDDGQYDEEEEQSQEIKPKKNQKKSGK